MSNTIWSEESYINVFIKIYHTEKLIFAIKGIVADIISMMGDNQSNIYLILELLIY